MAERRPKLALVTDAIFPYHRGGKEARYRELAPRLAAHADVHVFTMKWWDGPRVRREGDVTYHALCPLLPLYKGNRRSVLQAVVFALACLRLLFVRFDAIEADHMPYLQLFPLRIVARLRRTRLTVTWHECWGPEYWRSYIGQGGRVGWWFERTTMRMSDSIIAASDQTGASLTDRLRGDVPVVVAPNGVDLPAIAAARAGDSPVDIVAVGRLLSHKRIDMLLDAVALLRADGSPVTCRVIGEGPDRDALHEQARELGIAHAVDFRHDVTDSGELYGLMKSARVFAFPSEREGFGIVVLEALACGLPVVATTAPENLGRHLVDRAERGRLCEPGAASLAGALRVELASPPPAGGDSWLSEFDWQRVTDRVAEAVLP